MGMNVFHLGMPVCMKDDLVMAVLVLEVWELFRYV